PADGTQEGENGAASNGQCEGVSPVLSANFVRVSSPRPQRGPRRLRIRTDAGLRGPAFPRLVVTTAWPTTRPSWLDASLAASRDETRGVRRLTRRAGCRRSSHIADNGTHLHGSSAGADSEEADAGIVRIQRRHGGAGGDGDGNAVRSAAIRGRYRADS